MEGDSATFFAKSKQPGQPMASLPWQRTKEANFEALRILLLGWRRSRIPADCDYKIVGIGVAHILQAVHHI